MWIYGLILIALGILAAPSMLLSRRPDAKEILDKITPYQGWIGLIFCIIGIIGIIQAVLGLSMLTFFPIRWLSWLAGGVLQASLGFLLGYGMIQKNILSKNADASEKGEALLNKLRPMQGKLGLFAVIWGIWMIVSCIIF